MRSWVGIRLLGGLCRSSVGREKVGVLVFVLEEARNKCGLHHHGPVLSGRDIDRDALVEAAAAPPKPNMQFFQTT